MTLCIAGALGSEKAASELEQISRDLIATLKPSDPDA